jgi:rhodanese-related sulfurtransferase
MSTDQNWVITPSELKSCIDSVVLVDVREPEEYAVSHIQGSKLIPLKELYLRAEKELDKKSDIIVYCAHGIRSLHGLVALQKMGFEKIRSLEGGIAAWEELNGPLQPSR